MWDVTFSVIDTNVFWCIWLPAVYILRICQEQVHSQCMMPFQASFQGMNERELLESIRNNDLRETCRYRLYQHWILAMAKSILPPCQWKTGINRCKKYDRPPKKSSPAKNMPAPADFAAIKFAGRRTCFPPARQKFRRGRILLKKHSVA